MDTVFRWMEEFASSTFGSTFLATFLATLPAVYIGIWWERRHSHRKTRMLELQYNNGTEELAHSWRSVVYDIRDWAYEAHMYALGSWSISRISPSIRSPGVETLRYILNTNRIPQNYVVRAVTLLDYCVLLNELFVRLAALENTPEPDSWIAKSVAEMSLQTEKMARRLIEVTDSDLPGLKREEIETLGRGPTRWLRELRDKRYRSRLNRRIDEGNAKVRARRAQQVSQPHISEESSGA